MEWNFSIDVYNTFYRKKFFNEVTKDSSGKEIPVDFDFNKWEKVKVPSNWNTEKERYFFYEGTAIYTRMFLYEANTENERVIIKIGASNYDSQIWLNKKLIGRHIGGYTPYSIDITNNLEKENRLTIVVNNQRKIEQIPSLNYDWKNYGGIFRDIEVFRVPVNYISDTFFYLSNVNNLDIINAEITLSGESISNQDISIIIKELDIYIKQKTDKQGKAIFSFPCNVQRWDFNDPKFYSIKIYINDL